MAAAIVRRTETGFTVQVEVPYRDSMLDAEDAILAAINEAGVATEKANRLDYAGLAARNIPIGSGVTEAACKVLVKQRLGGSGMRWTERGAATVLAVRCLTYTPGRWSQFWSRIDRSGFPVAA